MNKPFSRCAKEGKVQDVSPTVLVTITTIQGIPLQNKVAVLIDSGSTGTINNESCFLYGVEPKTGPYVRTTTTMGTYDSSATVMLEGIRFSEFGRRQIPPIKANVFNSPNCRYGMIMGRDQLIPLGMILIFKQQQLEWHGHAVPMKPTNAITAFFLEVEEARQEAEDAELFFSDEENSYTRKSLQSSVSGRSYCRAKSSFGTAKTPATSGIRQTQIGLRWYTRVLPSQEDTHRSIGSYRATVLS